ncbi:MULTISPECIES: hypothetical protein [Aphanothece]|uniref:hypothetical protein n=1 Tax=Aphanothece TaxID=1121 RepID=UPI0039853311
MNWTSALQFGADAEQCDGVVNLTTKGLPSKICFMLRNALVGITTVLAIAGSVSAQTFRERATCKLTNTAAQVALYEGPCKVKQTMSGENTIFSVKMGKTEPFLFAGVRGQKTWMHGPEEVDFTDLPNGGIFRWSTFVLVVAE